MVPGPLHALISGGEGNEPVENRGWPAGSEHVANLETRLAHWEGPPHGGGQTTFDFREESTANFNRARALLESGRAAKGTAPAGRPDGELPARAFRRGG
ncbi:MAG: hypothetical protein HKN82_13495 [Akkermansiaceae bacterium]|nr:hypothetical protein [Akkermansiaceae bacterium]